MISGCSHSSRKRTTRRTGQTGPSHPEPVYQFQWRSPPAGPDSLPLRGRAQPLRRSRRRHSPGRPPQQAPQMQGQPSQGQTSASGIPAGCYLVTGRCPQADDERKQPHQRPGQGQRRTGLSGIYSGSRTAGLAPGLILTNANFSTQHSNGVTFYILEAYQILDLGSEQAA